MPKLLRRALAGFAAGAAAGWFAGLLRTPGDAPADSAAGTALRLPQEEFGSPAGSPEAPLAPGEQQPGDPQPIAADVAAPAEPAPPRRRRAAAPDPAKAAAAALRAGRDAAAVRLESPGSGS